jgi:hypothetical protein
MRGKVTYRQEARPRASSIYDPQDLGDDVVGALEQILGRSLGSEGRRAAACAVERVRFYRRQARNRTSTADSRATLKALTVERRAASAFDACDVTTRAILHAAAAETSIAAKFAGEPDDQDVREAAHHALLNFDRFAGQRANAPPTPLRTLAFDASSLWKQCGGAGSAAVRESRRPDGREHYATPRVLFAEVLFNAAGERCELPKIAKLLRQVDSRGS